MLANDLGVLLAWGVVLGIFFAIRMVIKAFTDVDIANKEDVENAKKNIKHKIASSKTANYIADSLFNRQYLEQYQQENDEDVKKITDG